MGEQSKIQWTEATWNPWHGCEKVSSGCKYCYMFRDKNKYGQDPTVVSKSKTKFKEPLKWKKGKIIFTCSWSDWFIEEADGWRDEAWKIIKATPHHTYQILTKRPERILECLPDDWGAGYPNVWLGVSIENEYTRIPRIRDLCDVPAKVRFVSAEPLIGYLDFLHDDVVTSVQFQQDIHWVIIGGESGNDTGKYRYRKCDMIWFRGIIEDCKEANIPVFVKQLGTHISKQLGLKARHGGDIDEWPEELRVREFPKKDIWEDLADIAIRRISELQEEQFPPDSRRDNQRIGSIKAYKKMLKYVTTKKTKP